MKPGIERNQGNPPPFSKTKSLFIRLFVVTAADCGPAAAQDTLGVAYLTNSVGFARCSTQVVFQFGFLPPFPSVGFTAVSIVVSTNDVGRIFPITQAQDTNFNAIVSKLTDGVSDSVGCSAGPEGGGWALSAAREHLFFQPLPETGNGIDFQGFAIDNIAFQIDALTIHTTASWTEISFRLRILVNAKPMPGFAPTLLNPVGSQTTELGSQLSLQPEVAGVSPLTYWWFFEATNAVGVATTNAAMTLTNAQFADSGAYSVIVSNSFGCLTSSPALLNVIPRVQRRIVPGLVLNAALGGALNLDFTPILWPTPQWASFDSVRVTQFPQWYFDLSTPLPSQGFYRAWQTNEASPPFELNLNMVPALTLTGAIGGLVRIDCINQFGPIDAWTNLAMVTLTNTSQLYFDTSSIGQPPRLWRVVSVP